MTRKMSDAQLEYERRRAAKANMTLEAWLKQKDKAAETAAPKAEPKKKAQSKKPGLWQRLIDRAHKPL